jgi:hypothetical protein
MKRRDLLKGLAALPVGAAAMTVNARALNAGSGRADSNDEEGYSWYSPVLGVDIAPGELTFLAGQPSNSKTALALDIALTNGTSFENDTWFFTEVRRPQKTADLLGIRLERVPGDTVSGMNYHFNVYRSFLGEQPTQLTVIEAHHGLHMELSKLHTHPFLQHQDPKLMVYDTYSSDLAVLYDDWLQDYASRIYARQHECAEIFDAAMIAAVHMTTGVDIEQDDPHPTLPELRQAARAAMIPDQVCFINQPAMDDWTVTDDLTSVMHMTRADVIGTKRTRYMLTRDAATKRYRPLNEDENLMVMGLTDNA